MSEDAGVDVGRVIEEERRRIEELRPPDLRGAPCWGLAHSGGGIRSAAFSIGVLQALYRAGKLARLDYLSTVSGGGYSGGSLTWFLERGVPPGHGERSSGCDFPFGRIGARQRGGGSENRVLDFIRQHAKYLTPGHGLDLVSVVGVALRSMFVSLMVYGALMVLLWMAFDRLGLTSPPGAAYRHPWAPWTAAWPAPATAALAIAYGVAALLVLLAAVYSLSTAVPVLHRYWWSVFDQRLIGRLWKLFAFFLVAGSVPWTRDFLGDFLVATAGPSLGVGSLLGLLQYRSEQKGRGTGGPLARLRVYAAVALLLYGLLLLTFAAAEWVAGRELPLAWAGALALVALAVGGFVNMNHAGLHRMYRDRLMETFLPDAGNVEQGSWGRAREADGALLGDMCTRCRPYHLVNTNIVLVDSERPRFRGRGGDSFLLSPLYCGSDATGWKPTARFNMGLGNRGMTLATAVAISGAAVNPDTGVAGGGPTRSRLVSTLMTLLNLRLGYWAVNPRRRFGPLLPANYIWPGIRGLLGLRLHERSRVIELSDGGHFENLGLYELVRRRARVIVVSDAGADPDFEFADVANAIERTRVDFGATIRFRDGLGIEGLIPGSASEGGPLDRSELAARGYAVADIWYGDGDGNGDGERGTLVYIKSTLTPGLPADVYAYKKAHDAFPDQPTSDQFFDEAQFEAYRELGYQLAKEMTGAGTLEPAILEPPAAAPAPGEGPAGADT